MGELGVAPTAINVPNLASLNVNALEQMDGHRTKARQSA